MRPRRRLRGVKRQKRPPGLRLPRALGLCLRGQHSVRPRSRRGLPLRGQRRASPGSSTSPCGLTLQLAPKKALRTSTSSGGRAAAPPAASGGVPGAAADPPVEVAPAEAAGYCAGYTEAELDEIDVGVTASAEALAKLLEDEAAPPTDPESFTSLVHTGGKGWGRAPSGGRATSGRGGRGCRAVGHRWGRPWAPRLGAGGLRTDGAAPGAGRGRAPFGQTRARGGHGGPGGGRRARRLRAPAAFGGVGRVAFGVAGRAASGRPCKGRLQAGGHRTGAGAAAGARTGGAGQGGFGRRAAFGRARARGGSERPGTQLRSSGRHSDRLHRGRHARPMGPLSDALSSDAMGTPRLGAEHAERKLELALAPGRGRPPP
nr:spidroin-1-like [Setaria viridis]